MTQPNLLELAKQGDIQAIASLMNSQLQPQGITAKLALNDTCLQVFLESIFVPNQQTLVTFLYKGLTALAAASIENVQVYAQLANEDLPIWSEEFELGIEDIDDEQPATNPQMLTISINLNGDNVSELNNQSFASIADKMTSDILSLCSDYCIQKVIVSNGISVLTKER